MSQQLNIIIPYYNGQNVIEPCLASIRKAAKGITYKIILVNNSVDKCNVKESTDLKIIETKKGIGFGRACNIGVYKNLDAEYFIIINQDALIDVNAIHQFLKTHKTLNQANALLSPFLKNYSFTESNYIFNNLTIKRNQNLKLDFDKNELKESYEINFASGACLFFSKHFVERFPLFDPSFFMYGEDDDLCHRVLKAGCKIILVSYAIVGHDSGFEQSSDSIKSLRRIYKRNANYLLRLKHPEKYSQSANNYRLRTLIKSVFTLKLQNVKSFLAFDKKIKGDVFIDLKTKIKNQIQQDIIS